MVLTGVEVMFNRYEVFGMGSSAHTPRLCTNIPCMNTVRLSYSLAWGDSHLAQVCLRRDHAVTFTAFLHATLRFLLGAVIMTAVAVQDVYAILAAFGVGFDIALGAGVMIATHVAANQVGSSSD